MKIEDSPAIRRLIQEDAIGQLRRQEGLMALLGSEDGILKLDWVEGISRLLSDPLMLEEVENEARQLWERGIRHIIWAGMGGSVIAVRVFTELGFCSGDDTDHFTIYPLDSTDPAALNAIVRKLAAAKNLALPTTGIAPNPEFLRAMLDDVMMISVSMGMTSEEPITHLEWFADLLRQARLRAAQHLLVMTLPGSYLERFAQEHQVPTRSLQLDGGTGTGGRMSAPTTRVFLLPAALYLTRLQQKTESEGVEGFGQTPEANESAMGAVNRPLQVGSEYEDNAGGGQAERKVGQLESVLLQAWGEYNLELAASRPADSAFVQLAAALSDASVDDRCRMLLQMPEGWSAFVPWVEQLMEESLGKGGKGVVVFEEQTLNPQAPGYSTSGLLRVHVETDIGEKEEGPHVFVLYQPLLASDEPRRRLVALAASFLGWQLSMALYGYLHRIRFAGQPAVENYKTRARSLRMMDDPLQFTQNWNATAASGNVTLFAPQGVKVQGDPAFVYAKALQAALSPQNEQVAPLSYLDFTCNGEMTANVSRLIASHMRTIGNVLLGVPVKLRHAPAAYHSTEQSEMDGPPYLVSLRLLARHSQPIILGSYDDTFLRAQAVSTWQAMIEVGRTCFLMILAGSVDAIDEALERFFQDVERHLSQRD
ncbi:MAG TPA: hypothetical protein VJ761_18430 [Ktedonobacteraceae bacterium]|nr:hypothetical protein [Ktedonobacteraceae bacterium]